VARIEVNAGGWPPGGSSGQGGGVGLRAGSSVGLRAACRGRARRRLGRGLYGGADAGVLGAHAEATGPAARSAPWLAWPMGLGGPGGWASVGAGGAGAGGSSPRARPEGIG
jgi:hypothetical protein